MNTADTEIKLRVNGMDRWCTVEMRTTLLDALRERLGVTSPKKGCDHGQCGACTVLVADRRILSCLTFAVTHANSEVMTAEGLADGEHLYPLQQSFIDHDGFQCGYCTPGQICSAIGMLNEARAGHPSYVTEDVSSLPDLSNEEIRERMSGNLCRCGAYPNIVAAIQDAATS